MNYQYSLGNLLVDTDHLLEALVKVMMCLWQGWANRLSHNDVQNLTGGPVKYWLDVEC